MSKEIVPLEKLRDNLMKSLKAATSLKQNLNALQNLKIDNLDLDGGTLNIIQNQAIDATIVSPIVESIDILFDIECMATKGEPCEFHIGFDQAMENYARRLIMRALAHTGNRITYAAGALKMNRTTLSAMMKRLELKEK